MASFQVDHEHLEHLKFKVGKHINQFLILKTILAPALKMKIIKYVPYGPHRPDTVFIPPAKN